VLACSKAKKRPTPAINLAWGVVCGRYESFVQSCVICNLIGWYAP